MGKSGRYGKYGEAKRYDRLQKAGPGSAHGGGKPVKSSVVSHRRRSPLRHKIKIVPATIKDTNFVRRLSRKVFTRYGPYDDTLADWFTSGVAWTVLAFAERQPVGFAMVGRSTTENPLSRIYELLAIAVDPEMQAKGIGSRLLKEVEGKTKDLKVDTLVLHTSADNVQARRFFKQHGFVIAKTKGDFYPRGQDALMMVKTFVCNGSSSKVED